MRPGLALSLLLVSACAPAATKADATELCRQALSRLASGGRAEEVLPLLDRAIASEPDHVESRLARGGLRQQTGRLEEALADIEAAAKARPRNPGILTARALLLASMNRAGDAVADATEIIAITPQSVDGHLLRGWLHRRVGRTTEAFQDFERARSIGRDRWSSHHNAAVAAVALRKTADAERLFSWAAELDPDRPEPHLGLGRVHLEVGRFELAIEDFTQALERGAGADAFHHRGNARLALQRYGEALADYDRAIAQKDGEAAYRYGRALARLGMGDARQAERDLTACLERDPKHRDALMQRAILHLDQRRLDDAEQDVIASLQIYASPENVRLLARVYVAREDWRRAAAAYESAIRLSTDDAQRRAFQGELDEVRRNLPE